MILISWAVFCSISCFGFVCLLIFALHCCVNVDPAYSAVASTLRSLPPFFRSLLPTLSCRVQSQQILQTLQCRDLCRWQHNKVQIFAGDQNCAEVEAEVVA